jgi:hypothetical protein
VTPPILAVTPIRDHHTGNLFLVLKKRPNLLLRVSRVVNWDTLPDFAQITPHLGTLVTLLCVGLHASRKKSSDYPTSPNPLHDILRFKKTRSVPVPPCPPHLGMVRLAQICHFIQGNLSFKLSKNNLCSRQTPIFALQN